MHRVRLVKRHSITLRVDADSDLALLDGLHDAMASLSNLRNQALREHRPPAKYAPEKVKAQDA